MGMAARHTKGSKRVTKSTPNMVVGYVRVSTGKQADSGLGIAAQRSAIEQHCAARGLALNGIVEDAGESGSVPFGEREGGSKLLAMLSSGDASGVVCYSLSRIGRSTADLAGLVELATKNGWAIVSTSEGFDLSTAIGRAMAGMLGVMAQFERELTAERTSAALIAKIARDGAWQSARKLGAVEGESEAVEAARALSAQGLSTRKIAAELAARGVRTREGTSPSHATIANWLKAESP